MNRVRDWIKSHRELLIALVWVVVAALAFTGLVDTLVDLTGFDRIAQKHVQELNLRAGVSYGIAQGINAVLSVIQKSSISLVVGDIALGEALDPVDDVLEQLSTMLLWSTISLSIQNFVYAAGRAVALRWIFGVVAFAEAARWCVRGIRRAQDARRIVETDVSTAAGRSGRLSPYGKFVTAALAVILVLRFAVPLVAYVSMATESLLLDKYETAVAALEEGQEEVQEGLEEIDRELNGLLPTPDTDDPSEDRPNLWERISDGLSRLMQMVGGTLSGGAAGIWERIRGAAEGLMEVLRESVSYAIDIIIVFAIQTIFLPLAVLWGLGVLVRHITS